MLTDQEIEESRGLPMADEIPGIIIKIQRDRIMTASIKAKGWRRTARHYLHLKFGPSVLSVVFLQEQMRSAVVSGPR